MLKMKSPQLLITVSVATRVRPLDCLFALASETGMQPPTGQPVRPREWPELQQAPLQEQSSCMPADAAVLLMLLGVELQSHGF